VRHYSNASVRYYSNVSVGHFSNVSVGHYSNVSVRHFSNVSVGHYSNVSVRHYSNVSVRHYSNVSVRHYSNVSVRHYSNAADFTFGKFGKRKCGFSLLSALRIISRQSLAYKPIMGKSHIFVDEQFNIKCGLVKNWCVRKAEKYSSIIRRVPLRNLPYMMPSVSEQRISW
jgi:hypothetical protein